ncbi:CorA-like Mg2+ transporter protein [Prosthecobacter fusiformis]|uniref:CorA-like Mg2+ transporter protein n=1 Tax=Prosthecobacter fusiformis TaxID=48464 RepID=A0A4R7S6E8_9BACT|nr:CorA family divalent cation transporter [Prosthecobacter fusiformis]TDU72767.1 CorA-like Mg2+ transporter protein [Prosthecobacter fusiformis]
MKPDTSILPKLWLLPDSIRNRLGREPGPQRAMFEDGHLLIILHQIPGADEHKRKPALFWRNPDGEWKTNLPGSGLAGLNDHLRSFDTKLTELEEEENRARMATEYHEVLEKLAPVLRTSRGLHRALQQARELVKSERELINMRDQAAGIERNADLLLQDAQFGLNFTVARQAEAQAASARQMASTAHRLNLLAAMFLPLTALASIFGMDFHSGMADTPANFWLVCASGLLLGMVVMGMLGKRH